MSSKQLSEKDKRNVERILFIVFFICMMTAVFFVYDIVIIAKESPSEIPEKIITVPASTESPIIREPETIVVSDKVVFLAHLTLDEVDYTIPFRVDEKATIRTLIERAGVDVGKNFYLNNKYTLDTPLFEDIYVEVGHILYKEVVEVVDIPFDVIEVPMIYSVWKGVKLKESEKGVVGKKEITYRVKYVDGVEVSSTVINEKVTKKPVTGKKYVDSSYLLDLRSGPPKEYITVIDVNVTAYNTLETGGTITATGDKTQVGYVAVDSSVIPLYSDLYIVLDNGFVYGYCKAMDVGGGIKGNDIDVFLPNYDDMLEFGRKSGKCYIISYGKDG